MDDFVFNKRKTKNIIKEEEEEEGTTLSKMQKKLRISCFIFEKNKTNNFEHLYSNNTSSKIKKFIK